MPRARGRLLQGRAKTAGHAIRVVDIGKTPFPLLRTKDEFEHGAVPAELADAREAIAWADHLVLIYPLWLGEMPAIVKGFLEQVLRPGFAFEVSGKGWSPKLRGKTARVVVTMGMPAVGLSMVFRRAWLEKLASQHSLVRGYPAGALDVARARRKREREAQSPLARQSREAWFRRLDEGAGSSGNYLSTPNGEPSAPPPGYTSQ